jgi:hypothetical protein
MFSIDYVVPGDQPVFDMEENMLLHLRTLPAITCSKTDASGRRTAQHATII